MSKTYEKQESNGLGWADQWDYNFNEDPKKPQGTQKGSSKEKMAEYNKKVKAAASVGMEKTKVAASVGAQKVASGTSASFRWIKEKVQKK